MEELTINLQPIVKHQLLVDKLLNDRRIYCSQNLERDRYCSRCQQGDVSLVDRGREYSTAD